MPKIEDVLKALSSNPDLLKLIIPLLSNPSVLALLAAYLAPSPIASPSIPIEPSIPEDPDETTPESLDGLSNGLSIETIDVAAVAAWADWLGGADSDHATPDEMYKIFTAHHLDLPPNGVVRFAAEVVPQNVNPVPLEEFAFHFLIEEENGKELAHIVVDKAIVDGQKFIKSVPNRWDVTRGWEAQIKHIPFYGNTAPDRKVTYWLSYKDIEGPKKFYTWRHHKPLQG